MQKGVYFIRGTFVQCSEQTILLDKYANSPSYRVGFVVTESLSTPEEDISLLDNATGSTNFAAKGAHRLKYTLTLTKKSIGTSDDADFVELMTLENGRPKSKVRTTEYSVLEETLAINKTPAEQLLHAFSNKWKGNITNLIKEMSY